MPHKARVMGKNVKYHHIRKLQHEYSKPCPEPLIPTTDKMESNQQMFNGSSRLEKGGLVEGHAIKAE